MTRTGHVQGRSPTSLRCAPAAAGAWWRTAAALLAGVVSFGVLSLPATAGADGATVLYVATDGTDGGNCQGPATPCATISFAVAQASSLTGDVTIDVAAGTYYDNVGVPESSWSSLTIQGAPDGGTVVNGSDAASVFTFAVNPPVPLTTLTGLTIVDGNGVDTDSGGGIAVTDGSVVVDDSTITGNTGGIGGGIENDGGTVSVADTTIADNSSSGIGGGIWSTGSLSVAASTLSGNTTPSTGPDPIAGGGGLWAQSGTATISNSTVAGNGGFGGGGIYNGGSTLSITNSTIANNGGTVGGGLTLVSGSTTLTASIVAGNSGGDCDRYGSSPVSGGYNVVDDTTCMLGPGLHDLVGTNPLAGSGLADNGGPTETMALLPGSTAISHVTDPSLCPATDQRGDPRGPICDSGAYDTFTPELLGAPQPVAGPLDSALTDQLTLSGLTDPVTSGPGEGTLTVALFSPSDPTCAATPAFSQVLPVAAGDGTYSTSPGFTADSAGAWHWTAAYSGDANNAPLSSGCSAQTVEIGPPAITSPAAATFTAGTAGSFTVTTAGGTIPVLAFKGALPGGLTFVDNHDGTGTLRGTPTTTTRHVDARSITATYGSGRTKEVVTQAFTVTIDQAPTLGAVPSKSVRVGHSLSLRLKATGYPVPSLTESGSLPTGVTFVDNGNGTATLSGTPGPGTQGSYPVTVTAANGVGSPATQTFTVTVTAA